LREYGKSVLKDNDFLKKDYDELKKDFYEGRSYFDNTHDNMNNVWHFDRTSQEERKHTGGHATPKPIALCSRAIKSSSREGEIVLDVFGGSGSTLIACEQLNRKCYMCELDPKYVSVILQRYINFKGSDEDVFLLKDGKKIPYSEVK
jgi:DNA modification methylase